MTYITKIQPMSYKGALQGFKVWVNGNKYPRRPGFWYTDMEKAAAIEVARQEFKTDYPEVA